MKNKEYYMNLKYPIITKEFEDEGEQVFSAEIKELPGLIVYGDSVEEVYQEIELAKSDWIDANMEWGREIPEPIAEDLEEYSGRITLRLPRTLHRNLKNHSIIESVSLNQTIIQLINDGFVYQSQVNSYKNLEVRQNKTTPVIINDTKVSKKFSMELNKINQTAPWSKALNLNINRTGENR